MYRDTDQLTTGGWPLRLRSAGLFDDSDQHLGGDITGRCDCCALHIPHTVERHLLETGGVL